MRDDVRRRPWGFMLAAGALVLAGTVAVAGPAGATAPAGIKPGTLLPGSAEFNDVYCTSSTSCWAVGVKESPKNALLNQIVRWNGQGWFAAPAPSPGGTKMNDSSQLTAVRCTTAANCWAVGRYEAARSSRTQALHWNGKKWAQVSTPSPGGTSEGDFSELDDVACTSAISCWAVGDDGNIGIGPQVTGNLAIHWNGKKWFRVATPNPAGTSPNDVNSLAAVRCASVRDCWAAGLTGLDASVTIEEDEMLHWNGKKWSVADVPSPAGSTAGAVNAIDSLSCTSARDCWAVGAYGSESASSTHFLNLALHWNGRKWSQATTPNPDGTASSDSNILSSVSCSSAGNCWAVGNLGSLSTSSATTGEALHWKGGKWELAKTPHPGGTAAEDDTSLNSVRCVTQKDCWAVGFSRKDPSPDRDVTLHWNSVKWSAS